MNALSEAGLDYDDRSFAQFAAVRDTTRAQLLTAGVVIGVVLIIAGIGLSQRTLDLRSFRDLGIVVLVGIFAFLGSLLVALIPMPRHYVIRGGVLEYPRWGGLLRGRIRLKDLEAFTLEGRDRASASIVLRLRRGRVLSLPEDTLASPSHFRASLAAAGLPEGPPRFRR